MRIDMKIILTGSKGHLGSNLLNLLRNKKCDVVCTDFDLCSTNLTKEFFEAYPEGKIIIHCASEQNTPTCFENNVAMTKNIVTNLGEKDYILFLSSSSIYGSQNDIFFENAQLNPKTLYASSKIACENIIYNYALLNKFKFINLRPSAILGVGARFGAVKDIYARIKEEIKKNPNKKIRVQARGISPGVSKTFIHVDDVCNLIYHIINRKHFNNSSYNVTSSGTLSIADIINVICNILNINYDIGWDYKTSPTECLNVPMSSNKITSDIDWLPSSPTSLSALRKVIYEYERIS